MNVGNVNLISIKLTKYDRLSDFFEYELIYIINGVVKSFVRRGTTRNVEIMIGDIINALRNMNKEKVEVWDNSTLDIFSKVGGEDFENVKKNLVYFFRRVNDRITEFKQNKSAEGYLDRYNSITGFSMNFS